MSARYTILVTDGEQRAALAAVRSLGKAGHTIYVASHAKRSIAGASRYAHQSMHVADPLENEAQFVEDIQRIIAQLDVQILIPITEASLLALLPIADDLRARNVVIPFADLAQFERISDKEFVLATARQLGIAVPQQHVAHTPAETHALLAAPQDTLQFPLVVKPARSVAEAGDARLKLTVQHAHDAGELRGIVNELSPHAYPLLFQQRIVGPGLGIFLLVWHGKTVASFAHRRLRERPPSGGVAVYATSAPLPDTLRTQSRALLDAFDWRGVAMIEYKMDERTGTPYLMEINGRFWGSLQLAIDAGVDFPALLVSAAMGNAPAPVSRYDLSIRNRWFWGDVDHLIARIRRSAQALALPPGAPSRLQAIGAFLRCRTVDRDSTFRWRDPLPFVTETAGWFRALLP